MSKEQSKEKQTSRRRGKAQQHRFAIKLMRPIFQTTVITVAAANEERAVRLAVRKAARLKEGEWSARFDPRLYRYDVQNVIDVDQWLAEAAGNLETDTELLATVRSIDNVRYLLLRADIEGGQGAALNQPWLDDTSYVFLADVAGDWLADIDELEQEGLEGYLCRGRRSNVIPFRRPMKDDDDDAG